MKESLRMHVEGNRSFMEEKLYDLFHAECLGRVPLIKLNAQKMKQAITEMFAFPSLEEFHENAVENINAYIRAQSPKEVIDLQHLIAILDWCIERGINDEDDDKLSKLQKLSQPPKVQPTQYCKESNAQNEPQISSLVEPIESRSELKYIPIDRYSHVKSGLADIRSKRVATPPRKQFILPKYEMPNLNPAPKYLQPAAAAVKNNLKPQPEELPVPIDNSEAIKNERLYQARLRKLFNHYCVQQISARKQPTFESIQNEQEAMSLPKFLAFCLSTKIFSPGQCSLKPKVMELGFKKGAEYRSLIDFEQFVFALNILDDELHKLWQKAYSNQEFPDYKSRLALNNPQKFSGFFRQIGLIFDTKDPEAREIKSHKMKKELTAHSGRFSEDLKLSTQEKSRTIDVPHSLPRLAKLSSLERSRLGRSIVAQTSKDIFLPEFKLNPALRSARYNLQ